MVLHFFAPKTDIIYMIALRGGRGYWAGRHSAICRSGRMQRAAPSKDVGRNVGVAPDVAGVLQ